MVVLQLGHVKYRMSHRPSGALPFLMQFFVVTVVLQFGEWHLFSVISLPFELL